MPLSLCGINLHLCTKAFIYHIRFVTAAVTSLLLSSAIHTVNLAGSLWRLPFIY